MLNRNFNKPAEDKKVEPEESSGSEDSQSETRNESKAESLEEYNQREETAAQASKLQFEYAKMIQDLSQSPMKFVMDPTRTFSSKDKGDWDSFISFGYARSTQEEKDNPNINRNLGWKAHIGFDDAKVDNIEKAFNIIKDIIIDEKITCKVTKPNRSFYTDESQHGKQLTIYCCANPEKDWENIFKRIEGALLEGNVEGDIPAKGDMRIEGSLYISYRNDNRGDDNYISSEKALFNYNYGDFPDPFIQFDISPPEIRFHVRP